MEFTLIIYQGMMKMRFKNGFTLIELLICVSILAITLGFAVPSIGNLLSRSKADANVRSFVQSFHLARSSAVSTNKLVTICPSNNFTHCSGDWKDPIMIFTDADNNKEISLDDKLIGSIYPSEYEIDLDVHPSRKRYFQYASTGLSHGTPGNIVFCPKNNNNQNARQIIINFIGRIRVSQDTNHDGTVENGYGVPLNCS